MLTRLAHDGKDAVVIVDNCPPEMHTKLVKELKEIGNRRLSLLTIEYDVQDDDAKRETSVFRLEPASNTVIARLITTHHRHISSTNAGRIVDVAGGNARLALALAENLDRNANIARLSDRELFDRLFWQGRSRNDDLLRAAETAALVYSFDGETLVDGGAELPLLAGLAEQSPLTFSRHIAELMRRKLIQSRGKWRAVMPQALALHLADRAMENLPPDFLRQTMENAPERLLKSFTRQMGHLHDNATAQAIVGAWLSRNGKMEKLAEMPSWSDQWKMFRNIAPVCPEQTLGAIQRAADGDAKATIFQPNSSQRSELARILASLAYDPNLFDHSAGLLARALTEPTSDNSPDSIEEHFFRLFRVIGSGTQAPQAQRLTFIDSLLNSPDSGFPQLGVRALCNMLNPSLPWRFSSEYAFGARQRNFGWCPQDENAELAWYRAALDRVVALACGGEPLRSETRRILAKRLPGLWSRTPLRELVTATCLSISRDEIWPEGWATIATMLRRDREEGKIDDSLSELETTLRATSVMDRIRKHLRTNYWDIHDRHDDAHFAEFKEELRELAGQLASTPSLLSELAAEMTSARLGHTQLMGEHTAEALPDPEQPWTCLLTALTKHAPSERCFDVLCGFIHGAAKRFPDWTSSILDAAVDDPVLAQEFPRLQVNASLDTRAAERLQRASTTGLTPISRFEILAYEMCADTLPARDLCSLLRAIAGRPSGPPIVALILCMQFHSLASQPDAKRCRTLITFGREFLTSYPTPENIASHRSHHLEQLIKICSPGKQGARAAGGLFRTLFVETTSWKFYSEREAIFHAMMSVQPEAVLDQMIQENARWEHLNYFLERSSPLLAADRSALLAWADRAPAIRYPWMAKIHGLFSRQGDGYGDGKDDENHLDLAVALISNAPDVSALLDTYSDTWCLRSWSGLASFILDRRRTLLEPLTRHDNQTIRDWATALSHTIAQGADTEREREAEWDRTEERFED